jgi:hypothetical protein
MKMIARTVALVALGALLGAGAVWARSAADVSLCSDPRTGFVKLGDGCGGQVVTVNQQGPQGLKGDKGDKGEKGEKGDPGPRGESGKAEPSKAETALHKALPAALRAPSGKPDLKKLAKLTQGASLQGVWAFSAFHDPGIKINFAAGGAASGASVRLAYLDVPAGKYAIAAKGAIWEPHPSPDLDAKSFNWSDSASCKAVAGVDFDSASATVANTISLNVVHVFAKPGRIELRCITGSDIDLFLENVKITAIRVDVLKNGYVAGG